MTNFCSRGHDLAVVGGYGDASCLACLRERGQEYNRRARSEALAAYGDGSCAACGVRPDDVLALHLDHVDGDGDRHRRAISRGRGGAPFVIALRRLGFPATPRLQTLCAPCHTIKSAAELRARPSVLIYQ